MLDVIGQGYTGLDDPRAFKNIAKRAQAAKGLELENKNFALGGQLHQRRRIGYAALEGRAGFRIKTKQRLPGKLVHAFLELGAVVDEPNRPLVSPYRQPV
mgnify:CR=1 FL=1